MKIYCRCIEDVLSRRRREWQAFDLKAKKLRTWRPFFALWPRRVGQNDCRWLEYIEYAFPKAYAWPPEGRSLDEYDPHLSNAREFDVRYRAKNSQSNEEVK